MATIEHEGIRYRENDILAEGSFGTSVYRGSYNNSSVAVKVIAVSKDAELYKSRLKKLIESVGTIRHPNILKHFSVISINNNVILMTMELCRISLKEFVHREFLDVPTKNSIILQVLNGLRVLHESNIVHGDITPYNVLLQFTTREVVVKISDFGLSKAIPERYSLLLSSSARIGSTEWMPPEILRRLQKIGKHPEHRIETVSPNFLF